MAFYENIEKTQNSLEKGMNGLMECTFVKNFSEEEMKGIKTHCRKWLVGGQLYEEDDELDLVPPGKSALIHYHDAEKGKENGGNNKRRIFSIMSPGCIAKPLGFTCGRLSISNNVGPDYYFKKVLRRVGTDAYRRSKQIPLSALFQRGWAYTMMFDIDIKETKIPFTDDMLLEWGKLVILTILDFYPKCKWTVGIPFLVCSRPKNQMDPVRKEWCCMKCGSADVLSGTSNGSSIIVCNTCQYKGLPKETLYYKIGAHFDATQIRDRSMTKLYQDIQENNDGTFTITGSAPTIKTSSMLKVREMLVAKIVKMEKDDREKLGLQELQPDILDIVDSVIYGSDKMGDMASGLCSGTNGALRPCFISKTKKCSCNVEYEKMGFGIGPNPECGMCNGTGVRVNPERKYVPIKVLDSAGKEMPTFQNRYASPTLDDMVDLLRLTSHHMPEPDYVTPYFVLPDGFCGGTQSATDIVLGNDISEEDKKRNNAFMSIGLDEKVSKDLRRYAIDMETGGVLKRRKYTKKKPAKYKKSSEKYFPESTMEGKKIRKIIEGIVHQEWPLLKDTYVGTYCMCFCGDKDTNGEYNEKLRTIYVINIAGQGSGWCSNARHCLCTDIHGKDKLLSSCASCRRKYGWGVHRQQKSPCYLQIKWNGTRAVVYRMCHSCAVGLDNRKCNARKILPGGKEGGKRALGQHTCTPEQSRLLYPNRMNAIEARKGQEKIQQTRYQLAVTKGSNNRDERRQKQIQLLKEQRAQFKRQYNSGKKT